MPTPPAAPSPLWTPPILGIPPTSNSQRGEGRSWVELLLRADPPLVHLVSVKATARHDKGDCGQLPKRIHAYPVQTVLLMSFDSPAHPGRKSRTAGFTRRALRTRQPPRLPSFPSAPSGSQNTNFRIWPTTSDLMLMKGRACPIRGGSAFGLWLNDIHSFWKGHWGEGGRVSWS